MIIIVNKRVVKLSITIIVVIALLVTGILFYSRRQQTTSVMSLDNLIKPIDKGTNPNYIAFTCNVDWGNEVLPDILETLKEKNVKITFFVTGRWVKEYPELFMTIVDEGHEIGSHGYYHSNYSTMSLGKNEEEIKNAEDIIMKYTNVKPLYFAPPSGAYNENTLMAAQKYGYKTILWTIDTIDWRKGSTSDVIYKRVMEKDNHNGAIVLMHPMEETAKALPQLIDALRAKGLEIGTVSDILIE
ncbi:polysaccharide deacetylase family protein [Alkaliphilus peptidifermentans]|uniref:Probable sporulation protein, polysaccharide deacetylase family n=1 Tax=Alkaliphilus peptidifermentans DSM 18978 TaxID=1120976 RepID=A0A1G5DCL9_9FIRM|nr:polysaccharide deacetylase family protein [Alkaliphilus peptidifermentans]SCY12170.1 probable sporulation protein, polysaccharide deacetylase family [Alkaliphilus peptidifermentans DSM 18978]